MASKPKRSSFPAGRSGAAQYQSAVRKFNANNKPAKTPRKTGGGQGGTDGRTTRATRGNRNVSNVTPGSNPLSRATPTKPGQSAYREEQEARRKAGKSYNPNSKGQRKPTLEPGSNPLQRAAKEQERKEKEAAAKAKAERERKARDNKTKPVKPVKPTKPTATKPKPTATKPKPSTQPKNAGAGNGAPRPAGKVPTTTTNKPHIKSDRLRDALKSVKKYKPKK